MPRRAIRVVALNNKWVRQFIPCSLRERLHRNRDAAMRRNIRVPQRPGWSTKARARRFVHVPKWAQRYVPI